MLIPIIIHTAHKLGFSRASSEFGALRVGQCVTADDIYRNVPKTGVHKITTLSHEGEKQDLLFIDGERQGAFVTHAPAHMFQQQELAEQRGMAVMFRPIAQEVHLQVGATILYPLPKNDEAQPLYLIPPQTSMLSPTQDPKMFIRRLVDDYLHLLANPDSGVEVVTNPPERNAVRGITPQTFTVKTIVHARPT